MLRMRQACARWLHTLDEAPEPELELKLEVQLEHVGHCLYPARVTSSMALEPWGAMLNASVVDALV